MSQKLMIGDFRRRFEGKRADEVLDFFPSYMSSKFDRWRTHSPMEVICRFLSGETMEQIGESYDVPKTEVAYALKVYGVGSMRRIAGTKKSCMIRSLPAECSIASPALGFLLGVRYGDGCCTRDTFKLTVADRDFQSETIRHLNLLGFRTDVDIRLSRVKPTTMRSPQNGKIYRCHQQFRLEVYGKAFTDFLDGIDITSLSDEQKIGFVNGFSDSEGCVERHASSITLTNTDPKLLHFVGSILTVNHVHNCVSLTHKGGISRISGRVMKDMYRIYIGRKAIPAFCRVFRFSIIRKQERLDRYIRKYRERTDERGFVRWVLDNRTLVENLRSSIEKAKP